jgi:hypothetical protein
VTPTTDALAWLASWAGPLADPAFEFGHWVPAAGDGTLEGAFTAGMLPAIRRRAADVVGARP